MGWSAKIHSGLQRDSAVPALVSANDLRRLHHVCYLFTHLKILREGSSPVAIPNQNPAGKCQGEELLGGGIMIMGLPWQDVLPDSIFALLLGNADLVFLKPKNWGGVGDILRNVSHFDEWLSLARWDMKWFQN